MQTFAYTARDARTTDEMSGEIEAENESEAAKILTGKGLVPIEVKAKSSFDVFGKFRNRISTKHRVIFTRQLSTLVSAGLPLVQSLNSVRDQTSNKALKDVVQKITSEVESGTSLADAMSHHPKVFDDVFISLVAAGEVSGTLDKSLDRLATQQEKDAEILSKVRGALVYPMIVLAVLVAVIIFMLTTVLPSVENLYKDLPNAHLPFITQALMSLSHLLTGYWYVWLLGIGGLVFLFSKYFRQGPGREFLDDMKLKVPGLRELYLKLYMARFARIGGTLVEAGVPIIQMLNTTGATVGNVHVTEAIKKATEQVKGGKPLSDSLQGDPHVTELVPSMIRIGEQSGSLEVMLGRLADYYEKEVDNQVKTLSTIIEPVLMVVVGVIAMIVVAAVLLPIYSLASKTGNF